MPEIVAPVAAAFAALDAGGVRWCLLRGADELAAPVGDIDLLVDPRDRHRAARALYGLGFRSPSLPGRGSHRFFVRYDGAAGLWIKLDVVTSLDFGRFGEYRTDAAPTLLARSIRTAGIPHPAPGDDYRLLLLHYLLDASPGRLRHRERLSAWARDGRGQLASHASDLFGAWTDDLDHAVAQGAWQRVDAMAATVVAALGTRPPSARWRRATSRAAQWLARRVPRPGAGGASVALMGPDGSGKSTLLAALGDELPFSVRRTYMGAYGASFGASRGVAGLALPAKLLKLWRGYVEGSLHAASGGMTIYDRYPLDALLPGTTPISRRARMRRWILAHACPPPDLVVILDAPAEVLFARKPEHDLAAFAAQREAYRTLGARLRRSIVLDATRSTESLRREVTELLWRRYARRLRRR